MANGIGFSLEHGYRLLRRTTGLSAPPLLSRQAVQVLGNNQHFSNRKARELLGWEPRVDYSAGLEATLSWLRNEYLERTLSGLRCVASFGLAGHHDDSRHVAPFEDRR